MTSSSFTRSFCAGGSGAGAGGCSRRPSSNFRMLLLLDRPCSFPNASRASRNGSGRYNSTLLAGGVSSVANLPLLRERSDFENPNSPTPSGWYENTSPIQPSPADFHAHPRCDGVCPWLRIFFLLSCMQMVDGSSPDTDATCRGCPAIPRSLSFVRRSDEQGLVRPF